MKRIFPILLMILALALAACEKKASTGPAAPGGTAYPAPGAGFPTPVEGGLTGPTPETAASMATIVAGGFATQTAQALGGAGDGQSGGGQAPAATDAATPKTEETAAPQATEVPAATAVPAPAVSCTSPYTVQAGDWVYKIGRTCNIHPDDIIAANRLTWPYWLYPGQTLILPENARPFPK